MAAAQPSSWSEFDPFSSVGIVTAPTQSDSTGLASSAGPGALAQAWPSYHPNNPMLWIGAAIAVTFGAVFVAHHGGGARASAHLGKAKAGAGVEV